MANDLIGLAGLFFIVIAWIPGVLETIKTKEPGMKKRFMALYFLGSIMLAFYSWQLNSLTFFALNIIALFVPIVHLYYYILKYGFAGLLRPTPSPN